jgi:peptidase S24-like protein
MPRLAAETARLPARSLPADGLIDLVRTVAGAGGSVWIRVTGISMNPMIREGDSVLLTALAGLPRRGDVVFVDAAGTPLLHRVHRAVNGFVVTRGDAALIDDVPVVPSACVAHAVLVRRGAVTMALAPTARFGLKPLLWLAAWRLRRHVPSPVSRSIKPLSRAIVRALS